MLKNNYYKWRDILTIFGYYWIKRIIFPIPRHLQTENDIYLRNIYKVNK